MNLKGSLRCSVMRKNTRHRTVDMAKCHHVRENRCCVYLPVCAEYLRKDTQETRNDSCHLRGEWETLIFTVYLVIHHLTFTAYEYIIYKIN